MPETTSPIELSWITGATLAAPLIIWMARDVIVDAYNALMFPDPQNPHRLEAAAVHLGFVFLMVSMEIGFLAIGLAAASAPQPVASPNLPPTQAIITAVFFTKLVTVILLSIYWRWVRREYRADAALVAAVAETAAQPLAAITPDAGTTTTTTTATTVATAVTTPNTPTTPEGTS